VTAAVESPPVVSPAYVHRPARARTLTEQVVRVARSVGRSHDPEQELALDVISGVRADGRPASLVAAVVCARQNLKTYVLENYVLTRMVNPSDTARLFIWTAQQLDTTEETFLHFLNIFDNAEYPHMRKRFKRSTSSNGAAEIELVDGRRIKFKARSARSGQGLTGDVVVLDEGFAVEPKHLAALVPTLSTRRRAQVLWGSSACHEASESLRSVVERGRAGGRGAPAYVEWCAPGSFEEPPCETGTSCLHAPGAEGCVLDRRDYLQAANPAAGRRIGWEFLTDERGVLPAAEYARERLGWHQEPVGPEVPPITVGAWRRQTDPESEPVGRVAFAVDIPPSRASASIAVAGRRQDGSVHVGIVDHRAGLDWVVGRVLELVDRHDVISVPPRGVTVSRWADGVAIDPSSPAQSLIEPLRVGGLEPVVMTTRDVGSACAGLQDAVTEARVWHRDSRDVDVALASAVRRDIGDGQWAFGRRRSAASTATVEIDPIVAVANARWCLSLVEDVDITLTVW
jgi:hypothetical protein